MKYQLWLLIFLGSFLSNTFAGSMGAVESNADFSGLYAGLGTGFTNIMTKTSYSSTYSQYGGYFDESNHSKYNNTPVLFTGQIGYGKMLSQTMYLGAKGSIYYTPFEINTPRRNGKNLSIPISNTLLNSNFTSKASIKPIYNVDIVLGYEVLPHLLPFIEAGFTFANVIQKFNSNRSFTNTVTGEAISYNHVLSLDKYATRYNVGIGANYLVRKNWFLFSELVYNDLGKNAASVQINIPFNGSLTEVYSRSEQNKIISLFAGVSYLFPV